MINRFVVGTADFVRRTFKPIVRTGVRPIARTGVR